MNKKARTEVKVMFGGRCAYCGILLGDRWHADHVKAVIRDTVWVPSTETRKGYLRQTGLLLHPENDCSENLFPACVPCNIDKGCIPLEDWRDWLNGRIIDGIRKNCSTFRHAERFGRVVITQEPLRFWFERYRESKELGKVQ